jgi:hypothetical protein
MYRGFSPAQSGGNLLHPRPFTSIALLGQQPRIVFVRNPLFMRIRTMLPGLKGARNLAFATDPADMSSGAWLCKRTIPVFGSLLAPSQKVATIR